MRARSLLSAAAAITLGIALGTGGVIGGVGGTPAYAAGAITCNSIATATDGTATGTTLQGNLPDDPFAQLRIKDAQGSLGRGTTPGEGVTVAVVDSGVQPTGIAPPVVSLTNVTGLTPAAYFHGTTVAGLIAGRRANGSVGGIAPGVRLLDLPVVRVSPNSETATPDWPAVAQALNYLLAHYPRGERLIVNMSLDTSTDGPEIKSAVERLIRRGAIVVAAGGNRASEDSTGSASPSPYVGTEDHNNDVFPADYPGVVAVGASNSAGMTDSGDPDPTGAVYANSAIDVAAPTYGARSWTLNGKPCVINDVATSWSTAIVSGVLALLWSAYPDSTNTALVDRLERTASGRDDERGLFTGAGIIQPYDAVTRPLGPAESPTPTTVPQAQVAPRQGDVLEGTRHDALWWGLLGGGALILALILRPLLSRRR